MEKEYVAHERWNIRQSVTLADSIRLWEQIVDELEGYDNKDLAKAYVNNIFIWKNRVYLERVLRYTEVKSNMYQDTNDPNESERDTFYVSVQQPIQFGCPLCAEYFSWDDMCPSCPIYLNHIDKEPNIWAKVMCEQECCPYSGFREEWGTYPVNIARLKTVSKKFLKYLKNLYVNGEC